MGTVRKKQYFIPQNSSSSYGMRGPNVTRGRNLAKNELGGVIFGCKNGTFGECLGKQLFGLPSQHFSYVKNIEPGLPLFLFNYNDKKLYGIFEAASSGQMNIDPYGWTIDAKERTMFPAQVQIRIRLHCKALPEVQFKPIIIDNYYNQDHFWFELDHVQATKLSHMFSCSQIDPSSFIPRNVPKWTPNLGRSSRKENGNSGWPSLVDDVADPYTSTEKWADWDEDEKIPEEPLNKKVPEELLNNQVIGLDEKGLIFMKLKELALNRSAAGTSQAQVPDAWEDVSIGNGTSDKISEKGIIGQNVHDPAVTAQLLKQIEELNDSRERQDQKIESLEKKLTEAEQEIRRLEARCMVLESGHGTDELANESCDELLLNLTELMLIVGGYNGISMLSSLHSYSFEHDFLRPLSPMSCVRSYASSAKLNGELFVIGGGDGPSWYDTAESYNPVTNQWTALPALNKKRGSLASVGLSGRIYVVGGGNGIECFSDVEMFDPDVGQWGPSRSMLKKRFALATAELNGALYAVGGYDGNEYLECVERFDPREHAWTGIASMHTKRGCHSLVVLNEKLYAIGGYDGKSMVPSVEIYDPRLETWMTGEPMNISRGYASAAVVKGSIYVVGGVKPNQSIVDEVECYKEGEGWHMTNLKAVGRRCFASAVVLGDD